MFVAWSLSVVGRFGRSAAGGSRVAGRRVRGAVARLRARLDEEVETLIQ
jgi:hypothetical protein